MKSVILHRLATVTLGPRNIFVINDLKLARELFDREDLTARAHTDWLKLIKISNGKMRSELCTLLFIRLCLCMHHCTIPSAKL